MQAVSYRHPEWSNLTVCDKILWKSRSPLTVPDERWARRFSSVQPAKLIPLAGRWHHWYQRILFATWNSFWEEWHIVFPKVRNVWILWWFEVNIFCQFIVAKLLLILFWVAEILKVEDTAVTAECVTVHWNSWRRWCSTTDELVLFFWLVHSQFLLFSLPILSRLRASLECMSEMCCTDRWNTALVDPTLQPGSTVILLRLIGLRPSLLPCRMVFSISTNASGRDAFALDAVVLSSLELVGSVLITSLGPFFAPMATNSCFNSCGNLSLDTVADRWSP